jgi:hypothetical protein
MPSQPKMKQQLEKHNSMDFAANDGVDKRDRGENRKMSSINTALRV